MAATAAAAAAAAAERGNIFLLTAINGAPRARTHIKIASAHNAHTRARAPHHQPRALSHLALIKIRA